MTGDNYAQQSDPDKNTQFRRQWLPPPPKRRRDAPGKESVPSKHKHSTSTADHTPDRVRLQYLARHLHGLGPRATFEFIAEIADAFGPAVDWLEAYGRIDPEILRTLGGDRFPARL